MSALTRLIITLFLTLAVCPSIFGQAVYKYKGSEYPIRQISEGELTYLSLMDLARASECKLNWDPWFFEAQLTSGKSDLVVPMFSNYVRFDNQLLNITYPALYRHGDIYVPAITFVEALDNLVSKSLFWDEVEKTIWAEESQYNIVDVNFEPKMNGYLIEIVTREKLPYEAYVSEQKWINVNIFGGKLDERHFRTHPRPKAIKKVEAFQFEQSSQLAIKFYRTISSFHHSFTTNPPRIQIAIVDTTFDPTVLESIDVPHDRSGYISTIVIDAGHGGDETGAVGSQGCREKDVTLSVAMKLKELFDEDGTTSAMLTRYVDTTLTLQQRADLANTYGDLFLSIHTDFSDDNAKNSGSLTFFLAPAIDDDARRTAMLENRSILLERTSGASADSLDFVMIDFMQTEYQEESKELASDIQNELEDRLKIKSRGVDQAGFFLLNKVYLPSVLIELAYLSNKRDEALLKKESFQQKAADAIYYGVKKFIDKHNAGD
ncbi:MAG: N-acetylmuramoyl-L-alanine amidase [Candidatus Zixiibacteriota bacterium]